MTLSLQLLTQTGKRFPHRKWVMCRVRGLFLNLFMHRRTAVAYPESIKEFLKLSSETVVLSAPFRYTHPPPLIPPFLKYYAGYIWAHPLIP